MRNSGPVTGLNQAEFYAITVGLFTASLFKADRCVSFSGEVTLLPEETAAVFLCSSMN
jgi:hypothetical protein